MSETEGLIEVLIDPDARVDERDDAAMDLGEADSDRALEALTSVGSSPTVDEMVLASCGESIGRIWVRRGIRDRVAWGASSCFGSGLQDKNRCLKLTVARAEPKRAFADAGKI